MSEHIRLDPVPAAIAAIAAGRPVVVVDDADRENEGDLIYAAALATDEVDPIKRYNKIAASSEVSKKQAGSIRPALLENWGRMSPRSVLDAGMRTYEFLRLADVHPVVYNFIISNVPGPKQPIYFLGAQITHIHPFGPLLHGSGLSVTSLSFDDHLDLGVITCEHLLPDPTAVAELIEEEFAELLSRARGAAPAGAA